MGPYAEHQQSVIERYPDWEKRLSIFFSLSLARRFRYGCFDCCLFVCDGILAMTGRDLAARFRGKYRSLGEARDAIQRYTKSGSNVEDIAQAITRENRMEAVSAPFARRGDLILCNGSLLGLVSLSGRDVVVLTRGRGLWRIPLSEAKRAWRV